VTGAAARREAFPKALRLRRRREFVRVQTKGEKHHVRHFLVFVLAGPEGRADKSTPVPLVQAEAAHAGRLPPPRVGVTVTRKVGSAVQRNRIRRWVREAFRRARTRFASGVEMVWVAKQTAAAGCYAEVVSDMNTMAERLAARGGSQP
jgi:ribonuclease P protein component